MECSRKGRCGLVGGYLLTHRRLYKTRSDAIEAQLTGRVGGRGGERQTDDAGFRGCDRFVIRESNTTSR